MKRKCGFTLFEMMVSIGLFLLCMALTFALFSAVTKSYKNTQAKLRLQSALGGILNDITDNLKFGIGTVDGSGKKLTVFRHDYKRSDPIRVVYEFTGETFKRTESHMQAESPPSGGFIENTTVDSYVTDFSVTKNDSLFMINLSGTDKSTGQKLTMDTAVYPRERFELLAARYLGKKSNNSSADAIKMQP